jgi:hypothetical protein
MCSAVRVSVCQCVSVCVCVHVATACPLHSCGACGAHATLPARTPPTHQHKHAPRCVAPPRRAPPRRAPPRPAPPRPAPPRPAPPRPADPHARTRTCSSWSASTSATMLSTIGTARGTTHGSWRPRARSSVSSPACARARVWMGMCECVCVCVCAEACVWMGTCVLCVLGCMLRCVCGWARACTQARVCWHDHTWQQQTVPHTHARAARTLARDCLLLDADGAGGLEGHAQHNVLPIADAALDAARPVRGLAR